MMLFSTDSIWRANAGLNLESEEVNLASFKAAPVAVSQRNDDGQVRPGSVLYYLQHWSVKPGRFYNIHELRNRKKKQK